MKKKSSPDIHKSLKKLQKQTKLNAELITDSTKKKVEAHVIPVVVSGFAFIVALVWRDFIRDIVELWVKKTGIENTYWYSLIVAILVTLVAIIVVVIITKKPQNEKK